MLYRVLTLRIFSPEIDAQELQESQIHIQKISS